MKSKITLILLAFCFAFSFAQQPLSEVGGGEFIFNPSKTECVTSSQRIEIIQNIQKNIKTLKSKKQLLSLKQKSGTHPLFIWPLRKSANNTYNEVYGISGYVDHNTSFPNQLTDYNCGTRSYDTNNGYNHQGVDFFTWPFGWKMMDDDAVEIIAAAPGQIVAKNDGEFDRSCNFNSNLWNAVYVQHSDGSIAWYGHMKNGSVTSKNVGDTVVEGEYLGVVGSSGNSTGPHLHFEVYADANLNQLIDPYSGSCNSLNGNTWWQSQRPYNNPGINAVLTHSADPIFPSCPTSETTNESDQFNLNQTVYATIFLKDQVAGSSVNLRLIRPDNTELYNWDFDLTSNYSSSWWRWTFNLNIAGEWKWQATYNGETVTHPFNVGTLSNSEENFELTSIYPNPTNGVLNINSGSNINSVEVFDVLGKNVFILKENLNNGIENVNLSELSNGIYFVKLKSSENQEKTIKLVKK